MKSNSFKPLAAALGASMLATALAPAVSAAENPFALNELKSGYQLAQAETTEGTESTPAEGTGSKPAEGKCGEGKCGAGMTGDDGGDKTGTEGKCGGAAKGAEGKCCGEGKCGGAA
jgi:uncharacterized low-complexity protein